MFEEEIARKIADFRELGMPPYVRREGTVHLVAQAVSTVVGARRSGKSYRVLQVADDLLQTGLITSLRQICPLDFDNPILCGMRAGDLNLIQDTFLKLNPSFGLKTNLVFIFDEIHRISGWEEYVIDLSRNPAWKVIVTGSSSKLLRDDISTALRGKAISSNVYPLSFQEYLLFRAFKNDPVSTRGQAIVQAMFDDYLRWGGYPALPQIAEQSRDVVLREYFDTMILKDIVERHDLGRPQQCIELYRYLLANMGRPYTIKSAYQFVKQRGHATSRDAIRSYVAWAEDAWLLFTVPIHTDSSKEQARNYKKLYCIDWALALRNSFVWDGSYSRAFENMVFLQLKRRYPRVCYYLTERKRQEVDFLVSDEHGRPVMTVQVSLDVTLPDTLRRELDPLVATAAYFGTKDNFIVTMNQEQRIERDGMVIHVVPAWKWLRGTA